MTDRLKTVYPLKTPFCGGGGGGGWYKQVFSIARTMNMRGNKLVFLVFGKYSFLIRWKNVFKLSGSHALGIRFFSFHVTFSFSFFKEK